MKKLSNNINILLKWPLFFFWGVALLISCSNSSSAVTQSSIEPTIKINNAAYIFIGPGVDTTVTAALKTGSGIKDVKAKATNGQARIVEITEGDATDGTVKIEYTAPDTEGEYMVTVTLIDEKGQEAVGRFTVTVDASIPAMNKLVSIVENVTEATAYRYHATDNKGHTMDTAKIIEYPNGGFLAVYHTLVNGDFVVHLATSDDLMNWTWQTKLGNKAHQPTIAQTPDGGFVVVWEQSPNNHLRFLYYKSVDKLLADEPSKDFEAPQTLSDCAEGTPNIITATKDKVKVGMHYYKNCYTDQQAKGTLINFENWNANVNTKLNKAIITKTPVVEGKIGDRDDIKFKGHTFILVEAQLILNKFGSWRIFLYNKQTGQVRMLNIETHGGSKALANPTISEISIDGQKAIVVTLFIPSQKSAPGEPGELIYYKKLQP